MLLAGSRRGKGGVAYMSGLGSKQGVSVTYRGSLIHELGHIFGARHTFDGVSCA